MDSVIPSQLLLILAKVYDYAKHRAVTDDDEALVYDPAVWTEAYAHIPLMSIPSADTRESNKMSESEIVSFIVQQLIRGNLEESTAKADALKFFSSRTEAMVDDLDQGETFTLNLSEVIIDATEGAGSSPLVRFSTTVFSRQRRWYSAKSQISDSVFNAGALAGDTLVEWNSFMSGTDIKAVTDDPNYLLLNQQ